MPDFPGEGGRDLLNDAPVNPPKKTKKLIKEAVKRVPRASLVPPPPTRAHKPLRVKEQRRSDIERVARDFRDGVAALQRLIRTSRGATTGLNLPGHATGRAGEMSTTTKEKVHTILEREMRTITRISEKIPIPQRHVPTLVSDFKHRAEAAFTAQVPQMLAAVMKADQEFRASRQTLTPRVGVVLRPKRGSPVEALMKVAKSIRAGRLPFVPAETKKRAQQLVDAVVGRTRGRKMAAMDRETTKLIERHKLVPLAVHGTLTVPAVAASSPVAVRSPAGEHTRSSERLETVLREIIRPANHATRGLATPISERQAQQLETTIPRFRDEGGVYGGPAIVDAGESMENVGGVSAIYREGSSHVQAPEAPVRKAAAPQTTTHRAPPTGDASSNRTHGGLGTGSGGGTVGASGGSVQLEGKLKIEGLENWIAEVQGTMKNV